MAGRPFSFCNLKNPILCDYHVVDIALFQDKHKPRALLCLHAQSDIDAALLRFARISISDRRPRNLTGETWVWREGNVACCHKTDSVETTLNKLVKENFLSMPGELLASS